MLGRTVRTQHFERCIDGWQACFEVVEAVRRPLAPVCVLLAGGAGYVLRLFFEPEVFELIPRNTFYLFGKQFFPQMLAQGRPLYGHLTASYWKDVGNLAVYQQTHIDCLAGRVTH